MSRLRRSGCKKAHLQVTGSEGASGIQTEDFKVEVQELGGGGEAENPGKENEGKAKTSTR
jgi:hypothetical protein